MEYRLKRGEQEFGPYSLTDLQSYLQSGHVAATDLAFSEGMSEWVPVSQVLGNIPIPAPISVNTEGVVDIVPLPPNLHWGWLLLLDIVTRSYFNIIWMFVLANWARKLIGKNNPLVYAAMYPAGMVAGGVAIGLGAATNNSVLSVIGGLLLLGGVICVVAAAFSIKDAMEYYYNNVQVVGLSLSGAMTFFFGALYLQFHVNRLARMKKAGEIL